MEDKFVEGGVCAARGYKANGVHCGLAHKVIAASNSGDETLKANLNPNAGKKNDLAAVFSEKRAAAAAVYTSNKVKGAPLIVTKRNIADGYAQAIICNSVNANTCNADGEEKAEKMCVLLADKLGIDKNDVIVASTGVIGQVLPIEPIEKGIAPLCEGLSETGNTEAVRAIMTTDTVEKECAVRFSLSGKECTLGGMLKGSGMICPNMATNLTFLTTDADISPDMLRKALSDVIQRTLNCVSVDGDMSTNDMCCVMANGAVGNPRIESENEDYGIFRAELEKVLRVLARKMAKDGEGATKLIECTVSSAPDFDTAKIVGKSVIMSNLFKAAIFGEDANVGRILCAVGYSAADVDIGKIDVDMASEAGRISVCRQGACLDFSEELAAKILHCDEIQVLISLNAGDSEATAWGCDLTYEYVKINGDYRS